MAGSLYLGSQKVCPSILVGGPEPTEYVTIKFPDDPSFTGGISGSYIEAVNSSGNTIPLVIDLNKLETIVESTFNYGFRNASRVIFKNLDSVKTIGDSAFYGAFVNATFESGYTDLIFENATEIGKRAFATGFYNSNITSLRLPKVTILPETGSPFMYFGSGTPGFHIYFNSVVASSFSNVNVLADSCAGITGNTFHFPSNLSDVIPNLTGYPNFSGTNTTILYDLEAT